MMSAPRITLSTPTRLCHRCRSQVSRQSSKARFISTTRRLSAPAAQLAERDDAPSIYDSFLLEQLNREDQEDDCQPGGSRSRRAPQGFPSSDLLPIPFPLHTAPKQDTKSTRSPIGLYPTTSILDSITLISVCLRRRESIPRAYQIFRQILDDSTKGKQYVPPAEVWGRVIGGVASLGARDEGEKSFAGLDVRSRRSVPNSVWLLRAQALVARWETLHEARGLDIVAGKSEGGLKVYQGWFLGLIKCSAVLEDLVPYVRNGSLSCSDLLEGVDATDLSQAYEALSAIADRHHLHHVGEAVRTHKSLTTARPDSEVRADNEIKPVLESDGRRPLGRPLTSRGMDTSYASQPDSSSTLTINSSRKQSDVDPTALSMPRFAISNLRKALSVVSQRELAQERQLQLEYASLEAAKAELAHASQILHSRNTTSSSQDQQRLQRERLQAWMHEWLGSLTDRLVTDLEKHQPSTIGPPQNDLPPLPSSTFGMRSDVLQLYLALLPANKLALITILEMMRQVGSHGISGGMKALRGMLAVGRAVETEYRAAAIKGVVGAESPQWVSTLDKQTQKPTRRNIRTAWEKLGKQLRGSERSSIDNNPSEQIEQQVKQRLRSIWTPSWTQLTHIGIGSYLVKTLLDVAKITRSTKDSASGTVFTEQQSAFTHGYDYVKGKKLGVIRLNPAVAVRLSSDTLGAIIQPKHLPMLVAPRPWKDINDGGYLYHSVPVMRFKESPEQKRYLEVASKKRELEAVYHGLDVLSSTPWTINRKVFEVILEAWNSGQAIADIPASEGKSVYPDHYEAMPGDPQERATFIEKRKLAEQQARKDHAERCKYNYNIEVAKAYLHDTFYLPHSMDFRGRAYPIPPHLSPVGDDLCRGLLNFGIKRPLGRTGLKWLQIHLANVYGFDKASFADRIKFTLDHQEEISDSADRPLEGARWWLQAEDPWQCLAACMDLTAALRSRSPDQYESALPVHQDGTCNGMQHYAALGGDARGAKAVNLENGDRPADVYSSVVESVNQLIAEDQARGHAVAKMLKTPLTRKVVKQTVMTTVYGVTFVGARDQIARQLAARDDIRSEDVFVLSGYITRTVLACIGDLFSGAKAIMEWLSISARLIAKSIPSDQLDAILESSFNSSSGPDIPSQGMMTSVVWTTPLKMPIVQPYRKAVKRQVMTALQTVYISDPNAAAEVLPQKQSTAFPPNYIHSLDATHMLLTAARCRSADITFASVHDSYWTHASTVETMSELIRDTFILLHSQDLIGNLRSELLSRFGDYWIARKTVNGILRSQPVARQRIDTDFAANTNASGPLDVRPYELDPLHDRQWDPRQGCTSTPQGGSLQSTYRSTTFDIRPRSLLLGFEVTAAAYFTDVLPAAPIRGVFDVRRIKDSAYFFS